MARRRIIWIAACVILVVAYATANAQDACVALVQQALAAVDENCTGLQRNSACYGFNRVDASFVAEVDDGFFTIPSDTTPLIDLEEIATAGLDTTLQQWGVAVMSVQANVPETLPGQNVTFMLVGDVQVENAVDPEDAFQAADPIIVQTVTGATVRSGPSLRNNVIGSLNPEEAVSVDARSEDADWLRVVFNERVGWLERAAVADMPAFDDLPVMDGFQRSPMQSFYLRTGIGGVRCETATDSVLVVQGPEDIKIDLTVNGARIQIGSTVIVRILPPGDLLEFIVIDGELIIYDDENGTQTTVPEGFRTTMCLAEGEDLGLDGRPDDLTVNCAPSTPEPLDQAGFSQFCTLESFPASLLNYDIDVQMCGEDDIPPTIITSAPNTPVIIFPTSQPPTPPPNTCDQFSLIAPVDAIPVTPATYSWTAYAGAAWYKVLFWNATENTLAGELRVDAPQTSVIATVGQYPTGSAVQWEVLAMSGEQILCSTGRTSVVQRDGDPSPPPPSTTEEPTEEPTQEPTEEPTQEPTEEPTVEPATLSASWACTRLENGEVPAQALISWTGADSDVAILYDNGDGNSKVSGPALSGNTTLTLYYSTPSGGSVSDSDETINLPALDCSDPNPPPSLAASWACTRLENGAIPAQALLSWTDADSDVTITYDNGDGNDTTSGTAPSGNTTLTLYYSTPSGGTVSDSNETINLPALDCSDPNPPVGPLEATWSCKVLYTGESPATVTISWTGADSDVTIIYDDGTDMQTTSGGSPSGTLDVELPFGYSEIGGTVADSDETKAFGGINCYELN
ncbi:SH3 domain-containing protein [Phototrophicus methaneseepsis]|uniref:SH3 domain-containing protein n=1 Tax=Phototrophicus methaneseepsis TaxID=2710758 RepID=A0A7S8E9U1_9CHLR|nr:SH3 domain-containing protein [Phototrophicus methaneseepsis]QPC82909.1 SH3 domain-containing protein [Phototrophicus methaneseepsis]